MNTLLCRLSAGPARPTLRSTAARAAPRLAMVRPPPTLGGLRTVHSRLELPYPVDQGMGEFLSPQALKLIAEDYQQGLLDRLNEEVKGTALQQKPVVQTVIDAAQDPHLVLTFNYASEALNNSFFLQSMRPPKEGRADNEAELTDHLAAQIRGQFGSLSELKSLFSASVLGMFGTGWMWLVADKMGQLAVYPTFGTGTLLVRSQKVLNDGLYTVVGEEPQSVILARRNAEAAAAAKAAAAESTSAAPGSANPPSSPVSGASHGLGNVQPPTQTRSMSSYPSSSYAASSIIQGASEQAISKADLTQANNISNMGNVLSPLMCVSVHEHAWVGAGYGVWGKEEYIKRFWSVANWKQASELFEKSHRDRSQRM